MLCIMHQGTAYGHLTLPSKNYLGQDTPKEGSKDTGKGTLRPILPRALARIVGGSVKERICRGEVGERMTLYLEGKTPCRLAGRVRGMSAHKNQQSAILGLLLGARGDWVPLAEILALGCSRYGARILELRRLGFVIENKHEIVDGECHSFYRLVLAAEKPIPPKAVSAPSLPPKPQPGLFDLSGGHRDDN
jgi:hypothetical protein